MHVDLKRFLGATLALLLIGAAASEAASPSVTSAAPLATAIVATTVTPTRTATATPTRTATATPTRTATATPTRTATTTPTRTATAKPTATAIPVIRAIVTVTPTTANPGGLVTVAGTGFAPNETVFIYFTALPKTVTTTKANASGFLPATGVSVPALTPGLHGVTALGTSSKRSAQATVLIQRLSPHISLSVTLASPGTTVTVMGVGFGAKEQVTLALNGVALRTTPVITTTTAGAFTASVVLPSSLLRGANTVSAVGNQSRVTAVAPLTGQLGVAAQFYFAGGLNSATEHSYIDLLNPNRQPASTQLTFYASTGVTTTQTVTVNPTAEEVVSVASFGLPPGTFGLSVRADRSITAQLTITRDGKDGDSVLGNTGLAKRWYLAEGYTGLTFHETISVLNPSSSTAAHVLLHLLPFGGRPGRDVLVTVPAHTNTVADINSQMPHQSLSIEASADQPVVVERTLTFGPSGYGLSMRAGTNTPATSWLFAEGTTVNRFETFLTILNPNGTAALVTASFYGQTGGSLGSKTIVVPGRSRANIKLNDFLSASGIATVLTSDLPVVVERPEYFGPPNSPGIPGSDVFGRNGAGVRWSFPGGDTTSTSEFLLLYNPSAVTVPVDATFYSTEGTSVTKRVYVPPTVRYNIDVNRLVPGFAPLHGVVLQSVNGQGFVAEQTVFAPNHSTLRSTEGLAQ